MIEELPLILSKNYIAGESTLVTSGHSTRENLFDGLITTIWISSGSSDTQTENIECKFYDLEIPIYRYIDRVGIFKHNLKEFLIQYFDGASWQQIAAECVNTKDTNFYSFAGVCVEKIRFQLFKTQVANLEKQIGEIYTGEYKYTFPRFPEIFIPKIFGKMGEFRTAFGVLKSWKEYERISFDIILAPLTKVQRDELEEMHLLDIPWTFYPQSTSVPEKIYQIRWDYFFQREKFYHPIARTAGYEVKMKFTQL